jgi:hypothetical protein
MNTKELIFDMDGTIADLYGVLDWLPKLRAENVEPYEIAEPLYDMEVLSVIVGMLHDEGYKIIIVSWGSKGGSARYTREVKKAKMEWLERNNFPYDEIHVVKYGTPKANYIKSDLSILVDDNEKVRNDFLKSTKGKDKKVINAETATLLKDLVDLLVAD